MQKRIFRWGSALFAALLVAAPGICGPGVTAAADAGSEPSQVQIRFGDAGWDSIRFADALAGTIAEAAFGYQWTEIPGSSPVLQQAIEKDDIDVIMEEWTANLNTYDADLSGGSFQELGVNFDDDEQGFYVPRYVIDGDPAKGIAPMAPNLKTVQDLKKYPKVFADPENPSKGRIYGAIPGWEINVVMQKKVQYYGLDQSYAYFQPGSDAALSAAFESAISKDEPIVGYYWGPTWLLGKYDMVLLQDAPYQNAADFQAGKTACPPVKVTITASNAFVKQAPAFCAFLSRYHTSSALISSALFHMQETGDDYTATAKWFLNQNPELLSQWLTPDQAEKVKTKIAAKPDPASYLLKFPFTAQINLTAFDKSVKAFASSYSAFFNAVTAGLMALIDGVSKILSFVPWWLMILLVFVIGWRAGRKKTAGVLYAAALFLVGVMGLWDMMYETLSIVLASLLICLLLGLPIGVLLAGSERANRIARPILDTMQTMPVFVYLIPTILFFGLGKAPAVIATTIYAVVPVVRLTSHGIRQVDRQVVEAARSFGATELQILLKVQVPLAMPTILTGVNQTLMMAMSMVVTCSMIGASGLGMEVLTSVNRIEMGRGLLAGTAVVILAVLLDRMTQSIMRKEGRDDKKGT